MMEVLVQNALAYTIQTAILIGAAAALLAILKLGAGARLWCLEVLLACCLLLPLAQPWRVSKARGAVSVSSIVMAEGAPDATMPRLRTPSPAELAAAIVALGIVIRALILALGIVRLRSYIGRARFVPGALQLEKRVVGVWPNVYETNELKGPVTFGVFRPAVLIPTRWFGDRTIAYHELVHVRRRDWAFTVAEELVRVVLWFHPGMWWLIGQIQLAREEVVDREAVRLLESREQYLETLLAIAEANAALDLAPAPLFLKKRHLRQRVAALIREVNMSKFRMGWSVAGFAATVAIAGWMGVNSFPLMAGPQAPKDSPGVTVQTDESKVLHRAPVHYPEDALSKGIQGTVVLEATLDQSGAVVDAQVVSGPPELRKAALESVLQWHFNRDLVAASKTRVAIDFALPGAGAPAKVKRVAPVMEGPVRSVDVTRLPQPLRDKVTSALTLRAGDTFNADAEQRLRAALAGIDEHLQISTGRAVDGGVALRIELENAHGMAPQRIRVGGNVQAANIVEKVVPKYPPEAKEQRIQGTVRFTATIGKDGHVISLDLVSGEPILADAAREAVQQWVYKPTLLNGEPVEVVTQIDVNFTLSK